MFANYLTEWVKYLMAMLCEHEQQMLTLLTVSYHCSPPLSLPFVCLLDYQLYSNKLIGTRA